MSRQGQRFRAIKDDTNNPTLFKITQSQTFLEDETVLSHVDEFINNHPLNSITANTGDLASVSSSTYTGINPTVLSQLNRLQRNLKGLPPLFDDENPIATTSKPQAELSEVQVGPKVNKKIVFDE